MGHFYLLCILFLFKSLQCSVIQVGFKFVVCLWGGSFVWEELLSSKKPKCFSALTREGYLRRWGAGVGLLKQSFLVTHAMELSEGVRRVTEMLFLLTTVLFLHVFQSLCSNEFLALTINNI